MLSIFSIYLEKEKNNSSLFPFVPLIAIDMGHHKRPMMKIENPISRQAIYSKRRDAILKKANELSVLCDADVGLMMFSPAGRLTVFSSNGRIEDIFLRYAKQPNELRGGRIANDDYVYQCLRRLKHEGDMLEKMQRIEDLQEKLQEINQRQQKAVEKISFYNPDLNKITSDREAQVYQQFLTDSIRCIQNKKQLKLIGKEIILKKPKNVKETVAGVLNTRLEAEEFSRKRKSDRNESAKGNLSNWTWKPPEY